MFCLSFLLLASPNHLLFWVIWKRSGPLRLHSIGKPELLHYVPTFLWEWHHKPRLILLATSYATLGSSDMDEVKLFLLLSTMCLLLDWISLQLWARTSLDLHKHIIILHGCQKRYFCEIWQLQLPVLSRAFAYEWSSQRLHRLSLWRAQVLILAGIYVMIILQIHKSSYGGIAVSI